MRAVCRYRRTRKTDLHLPIRDQIKIDKDFETSDRI